MAKRINDLLDFALLPFKPRDYALDRHSVTRAATGKSPALAEELLRIEVNRNETTRAGNQCGSRGTLAKQA
jgi:hypothetical protein